MQRLSHRALLVALSLTLSACDAPAGATNTSDAAVDVALDRAATDAAVDAHAADAALDVTATDVTATDVTATDATATDITASDVTVDASTPMGSDEILGTLRGTCGTIRAMLHSPSPALVRNDLVFMAPERYARDTLSPGGQRLFDTANAGGSSSESEVMSYEALHFCEGASLLRTETEIHYAPPDDAGANSITDILVEIGGERVGVSVTRAYVPMPMVLSEASVRDLMTRKLQGINRSSVRVLPEDRWVKQILHVLAVDAASAALVERVWMGLDAATRADTIVVLTTTRGGGFIYCNPDPPLGNECPPIGG